MAATCLVAAVVLAPGCRCAPRSSGRSPTPSEAEHALTHGVQWLLERQEPDGSWRSATYGQFKDGDALTALVVRSLQTAHADHPETQAAIASGIRFLEGLAEHARDPERVQFPTYSSSLAIETLPESPAREMWLELLRSRQLTEELGWEREDKEYGGWGYSVTQPIKPKPNELAAPLIESNVSATTFAIDALKSLDAHGDACGPALAFMSRMQNEDGGFHFIYDDPVRNKAGGEDGQFFSYGSTSSDGFRVLHACGGEGEARAAAWLRKNYDGTRHPGEFVERHEPDRDGLYYYWAASVARSFTEVPEAAPRKWRGELMRTLVDRQREDGSWENPVPTMRENDPVVATAFAVYALSLASAPATTSSAH